MAGVALVLAVVSATACGDAKTSAPPRPKETLPPMNDLAAIDRLYGGKLAALGLTLTRAARFPEESAEGQKYSPTPDGTHFALYAEPIEPFTAERFVTNIVPLTKIFAPDVFRRWPGLTSFDICQEPIQSAANEEQSPVPVTQIRMSKEQSEAIDWTTVDLPELIRLARSDPPGLFAFFTERIRRHPVYGEAFDEAERREG